MPPRPAAKGKNEPIENKNVGKVPKYIEKYKEEAK